MIDINKTYRTRDGREVRIYSVDAGGQYPVHGAIKVRDDIWKTVSWTKKGTFSAAPMNNALRTEDDLVEVKPRIKRTVWVNIYSEQTLWHTKKEYADNCAGFDRIACVKVEIDCEEGEGL
jgi:hypothetical protein